METQAGIPSSAGFQRYSPEVEWETDLDETIGLSRISLKPILVYFTATDCLECVRYKRFSLDSDTLKSTLRKYERVEVDLSKRPELTTVFHLKRIPSLYIIEPDGRIREQLEGYRTAKELKVFLNSALRGYLPAWNIKRLTGELQTGKASKDQWRKVLLTMENVEMRRKIEAMSHHLTENDRKILVLCLSDDLLAVRLGALELLEDMNNSIHGFDPWSDPQSNIQKEVLNRWQKWAGSRVKARSTGPKMSREQFDRYMQDLISEKQEPANHALRALTRGGKQNERWIEEYLALNPALSEKSLRRIKEVQFSLVIPSVSGIDPQVISHRIIWGNQDVQIRSIRQLADCGTGVVPVLVDLLNHRDPLVREASVEILFTAAGDSAVSQVKDYLKRETDPDIIFTVLRQLGKIELFESQTILESYFAHENEDLVIAAIEGAVKMSVRPLGDKLILLLEDKRWRVRVAALDAIKKKGGYDSGLFDRISGKEKVVPRHVSRAIIQCLDDPDEFVRHTAAVTLGELGIDDAELPLKAAYGKYPDMHGVIISVLIQLEKSISGSYVKSLFGPEPDELLFVLDRIKKISSNSRELVHQAAESGDPDIACSALRIMANSEKRNSSDNVLLIQALKDGATEQKLTVIQEFDLDSDKFQGVKDALKNNENKSKTGVLFSRATDSDILFAVSDIMDDPTVTDLVRTEAVILLCGYGHDAAFQKATVMWEDLTASMRTNVAKSIHLYGIGALPLFTKALSDTNSSVWETAVNIVSRQGGHELVKPLIDYLLDPASRLTPSMVWPEGLYTVCREKPRVLIPFAKTVLKDVSAYQAEHIIFALTILTYTGITKNQHKPVQALCNSENPFVRRSAWIARAAKNKEALLTCFDGIKKDSSRYVREIIPSLLFNNQYDVNNLNLYFSEEVVFTGYDGLRIDINDTDNYGYERTLSPEVVSKIKLMLAEETEGIIRFRLILCLLSYQIPYDLNEVIKEAKLMDNPPVVSKLLSDFFYAHHRHLGDTFKVLLPLIQSSDRNNYSNYGVKEYIKRWGRKISNSGGTSSNIEKNKAEEAVTATYVDPFSAHRNQNVLQIELVFFTASGCLQCDDVERYLKRLRYSFPGLRVQRHDIYTPKGLSWYQALCEKFQVDERQHSVVPAVFMSGGYLIGGEIRDHSLYELIDQSGAYSDGESLLSAGMEELNAADSSIRERFQTYSWYKVARAGFLQGINPNALIMMVFLLIYLIRTGQEKKDMLRNGLFYLIIVLITPLGLWVTALGVHSKINSVSDVRNILFWMILIFMVIASLRYLKRSFFSFKTKKKKEPAEKKKVHRHNKRVMSVAVLWGLVVSILNLIAIGDQNTATLVYMVRSQAMVLQPAVMLIFFNLAFILPSAAMLVASVGLVNHQRLQSFLRNYRIVGNMFLLLMWCGLLVNFLKYHQ